MDKITIKNDLQHTTTILPNDFIDHYMIKADGEYVKIYLLILRLTNSGLPIEVERLADTLELTQKDVIRALKYWEKEGLLELSEKEKAPAPKDTPVSFTILQAPAKTNKSMSELEQSIKNTNLEQTLYMAETYLGRPLSNSELNTFCYIADSLHFTSELLEYLIEYCVSRNKKSVRYMESVAINWFGQGIDSVKKAKEASSQYTQNVFPVMKAFGFANRNPGPAELDYIKKWNTLGFDTDIIVEACNRTILQTHQASFPYATRILTEWKNAGVHTMADIKALDSRYHATVGANRPASSRKAGPATVEPAANSFHNFEQRSYNYDDLETRLLEKNR
ncbi:MAG: DnaD domain protein [Clostridiales bacterium]|nr:DnaD domain protein [Clostridiales bacterium]